jgi:hypothetical protein
VASPLPLPAEKSPRLAGAGPTRSGRPVWPRTFSVPARLLGDRPAIPADSLHQEGDAAPRTPAPVESEGLHGVKHDGWLTIMVMVTNLSTLTITGNLARCGVRSACTRLAANEVQTLTPGVRDLVISVVELPDPRGERHDGISRYFRG